MTISRVRLQNYRSHKDAQFVFTPGANTIVGANAAGKTNILEAIFVAVKGKSFQLSGVDGLIAHDEPWARIYIESDLVQEARTVKLFRSTTEKAAGKEFLVDQKTYKRLPSSAQLPIVLFVPEHLRMVRGNPEMRRSYLDGVASVMDPQFTVEMRDYLRTLTQCNQLIKQAREVGIGSLEEQFLSWHQRLAESAVKIDTGRLKALESINEETEGHYREISSIETQTLRFHISRSCEARTADEYKKLFKTNIVNDLRRGVVSVGPHRDDMSIILNGVLAKETASRGEMRSIVLALKYYEVNLVKGVSQSIQPLLLFDDVLSELDAKRSRMLLRAGKDMQKIITTTSTNERKGVIKL